MNYKDTQTQNDNVEEKSVTYSENDKTEEGIENTKNEKLSRLIPNASYYHSISSITSTPIELHPKDPDKFDSSIIKNINTINLINKLVCVG